MKLIWMSLIVVHGTYYNYDPEVNKRLPTEQLELVPFQNPDRNKNVITDDIKPNKLSKFDTIVDLNQRENDEELDAELQQFQKKIAVEARQETDGEIAARLQEEEEEKQKYENSDSELIEDDIAVELGIAKDDEDENLLNYPLLNHNNNNLNFEDDNVLDCGRSNNCDGRRPKHSCKKCLINRVCRKDVSETGWKRDISEAAPDILTNILDFAYNFKTPHYCNPTYSGTDWHSMSKHFSCNFYVYIAESRVTVLVLAFLAFFNRYVYDAYARKMIEEIYSSKKTMVTDSQKELLYYSAELYDGNGWAYSTDGDVYSARFAFVWRVVVIDTLCSYSMISFWGAAFSPLHSWVYFFGNLPRDLNVGADAYCDIRGVQKNECLESSAKWYNKKRDFCFFHVDFPAKFLGNGYDYTVDAIVGSYRQFLPKVPIEKCTIREVFCSMKTYRMLAKAVGIIIELCAFSELLSQFFTMHFNTGPIMGTTVPILVFYYIARSKAGTRPFVVQWWFQTLFGTVLMFYKPDVQWLPNLVNGMLFKGMWHTYVQGDIWNVDAGKQCSFEPTFGEGGTVSYETRFVEGETDCFKIVKFVANLDMPFVLQALWFVLYGGFFTLLFSTLAGFLDHGSFIYKYLPKRYRVFIVVASLYVLWYVYQSILGGFYKDYFPAHVTAYVFVMMFAMLIYVLEHLLLHE